MARLLLSTITPHISFQFLLPLTTLLFCAFALFMCAHSSLRRSWRACYEPDNEEPNYPVIEHIQPGNIAQSIYGSEQEDSLWQKNILMGGKCELPDFSGVIIYDSNGNIVSPAKPPRPLLTWK